MRTTFCLSIPQKLYMQLKSYVEQYGDKGETIASIIVAGAERELKERIAKKLTRIIADESQEKQE